MTTQGTVTVTVAAPPEAVWPWVGDLDRHAEWSPRPFEVSLVSGEPGAVGSRYRSAGWVPGDKHHVNEVEITESVPPSRLALESREELGTFHSTYDLRTVDAGTEVTFHLVFPPLRGAAAALVPILFPLVGKPDIRKRMQLLKAKVEAG